MTGDPRPYIDFGLGINTRRGTSCSLIMTHFNIGEVVKGLYEGVCCVVGEPGSIMRDHERLLNRLAKHMRRLWQPVKLRISDQGYDYQIDSGLRAVISRGTKGTLFEYGVPVAKVRGNSTAWIQVKPIRF